MLTSATHGNLAYLDACERAASDDSAFAVFKQNPAYTQILEHVSQGEGRGYIAEILKNKRVDFAPSGNDKLGSPTMVEYDVGRFSPTTLRYLKIANDILGIFSFPIRSIVEIGAGYGGQCVVLSKLLPFEEYTIIDLPPVLKLIDRYLSTLGVCGYELVSALDMRVIPPADLVISSYAFSECTPEMRDAYLRTVVRDSRAGYFVINHFDEKDKSDLYSKLVAMDKTVTIRPNSPHDASTYILTHE